MDRTQVGRVATPPPPPPKRGTGAFVVLLLVLLAVLGGLLWFVANETGLIGDTTAEKIEMPLVIGKTQEEATTELEGLGLEVQVDTLASDQQEPGRVFGQDPPGGNQVDKGAAVTIKVVAEAEKVKVPTFTGKDIDDARDLAEAAGLNLTVKEEPSATIEADKVISQNPAPQTELAKGSAVEVVVSSGRNQKAVPDVSGSEAAQAANELGQAGFKSKVSREASNSVDEGKVIRTDPPAGTRVPEGDTITIVVSTGAEQITVPNVMGKTAEDAKAEIEAAGLVFQNAGTALANADSEGKVIAQNPSGGTKVEKGSTVRVTIGRSALPTTTTAGTTTSSTATN